MQVRPIVHHAAETFGRSRLVESLERLARRWAAAQRRRRIARTARSLETLSDAALNEMGVPRSRIRQVAAEAEDQGHRR